MISGFHPEILVWGGSGQGSFHAPCPPITIDVNYVFLGVTDTIRAIRAVISTLTCTSMASNSTSDSECYLAI